MATPLSEVITYLNFDGTIAINEEHETIKVLLQEFGSMSITVVSDQNLNFLVEFSNDSINFDYTNSSAIGENTRQTITTVILGKWCRIRALNPSKVIANVRFTTFCQVIPIATQSQIESEGNNLPTFNVDNLSGTVYNDLKISEKKPVHQHNFTYASASVGVITNPDRELLQTSGGGFNPVLSPATIVGNVLTLSNIYGSVPGAYQCVYGPPVIVNSGNPVYINFSASFSTVGYIDGLINGYDQMLVGMGYVDIATGDIIDGFYIGYPSSPNPPATITDEIALVVFTSGVENHVVQSQWGFDRLDGNGPSRILLNPETLSTWRIRTAIVNSLYLEYHNPLDNVWIPCHRIQFENLFNTTEIENPSYGYNIYTKRTSIASGFMVPNGGGPQSAQGVVGIEVGQNPLGRLDTYSFAPPTLLVDEDVETEIFSIRSGELLNNITNRSIIAPTSIFVFSKKDPPSQGGGGSVQGVTLKIYKNGSFSGSTWVYRDPNYDPLQTDITSSAILGTGFQIANILHNVGLVTEVNLKKYNSILSRLDTLTFTISAPLSDVDVSMALNYDLVI